MYPVLIHLGSFTLYTYGVLLALAFVLGTTWSLWRARHAGLDETFVLLLVGLVILCGMVGARLLYVAYFPDLYAADPMRILTDRGGLVWYGGVMGGLVGGLLTIRLSGQWPNLLKLLDLMSAPLVLGLAIGRLGCFASGCCYGHPTTMPWGVQFPPGHVTHPLVLHPTQLYESAAALLLLALLVGVAGLDGRKQAWPGQATAVFLAGYGLIRFTLEFFRGDVVWWVAHVLSASQVISLLAIGLAGVVWWCNRQNGCNQQ